MIESKPEYLALSARLFRASEALALKNLGQEYNQKPLDWVRSYLRDLSATTDYFLREEGSKTPDHKTTMRWFDFKKLFRQEQVVEELELVYGMLYGLERTLASKVGKPEHLEEYFLRIGELFLGKAQEEEFKSGLSGRVLA